LESTVNNLKERLKELRSENEGNAEVVQRWEASEERRATANDSVDAFYRLPAIANDPSTRRPSILASRSLRESSLSGDNKNLREELRRVKEEGEKGLVGKVRDCGGKKRC